MPDKVALSKKKMQMRMETEMTTNNDVEPLPTTIRSSGDGGDNSDGIIQENKMPDDLTSGEKRVYSKTEKLLLIAALSAAILFDRLTITSLINNDLYHPAYFDMFWFGCILIFCSFFWKKFVKNPVSWYIAGCIGALCIWSLFYWKVVSNANNIFSLLNFMIIPAVLMGLIVFTTGEYKLKEVWKNVAAWLLGWWFMPFSGIPVFFGSAGSLFSGVNKNLAKKIASGITLTLLLLLVILPLLGSADKVFGYHLGWFFEGWDIVTTIAHIILTLFAAMLFYSLLWNAESGAHIKTETIKSRQIDMIISSIILCSVITVYILFCIVQFTYLFAGAGLPGGMTYSEYAREGFAQTVVVCAINLALFGIFLHYGKQCRMTTVMLAGLLVLTGIMLISGFVRLGLYIDTYGMTWLRLISAWFIIYMSAVIILCAIRIWISKIPLIAVCALILLGWYVVLGYIDPDGFIDWYNVRYDYIMLQRY